MPANPKDAIGRTKPALSLIPGTALVHVARAFEDGAKKYGPYNWREYDVAATVYVDAALRHLLSWHDGEETSRDTNPAVHHLAHAISCLCILLDAAENNTLIDDRPLPGKTADLINKKSPEKDPDQLDLFAQ